MMDLLNDETDEEIELVEISDAEGNRAEMRRLATVEYSGKLYHILGAVQEDETDDFSDDGLVLVRQGLHAGWRGRIRHHGGRARNRAGCRPVCDRIPAG